MIVSVDEVLVACRQDDWGKVDSLLTTCQVNSQMINESIWMTIIEESFEFNWHIGTKIFKRLMKHGPSPINLRMYLAALFGMSKQDMSKEALKFFDTIPEDIIKQISTKEFEKLLAFTVKRGRAKEALGWAKKMESLGIPLTHKCYRSLINACNKGGKQMIAAQLMDEMMEKFVDQSDFDS